MKVVAFNGSPRSEGNTFHLVTRVLSVLQDAGIETELIRVGGKLIRGCTACYECFKNQDGRCILDQDMLNGCIDKMREADGIILASPTYFADVTCELKALIDRAGFVAKANGNFLKRKAGAAVVAVRRAGGIHAFDTINHFFLISEMVVPGSSYWNLGFGRDPGEVEKDQEGMLTMTALGQNLAWLLKRLK